MKEPVVVIQATSYGGIKKMDVVGDNGENVVDLSIFDAIEAGFKKVILIIRREHEEAFRKLLGQKIFPFIEVEYAYQDLANIPKPYKVPTGRVKPWGSTQALLSCKALLDAPFLFMNADAYYGKEMFRLMYTFLYEQVTDNDYALIDYQLTNTLSEYGSVNRELCEVKEGILKSMSEKKQIKKTGGTIYCSDAQNQIMTLPAKLPVSMNCWGFTPRIMEYLEHDFTRFLSTKLAKDPLRCEHRITDTIANMLDAKSYIRIHAMQSREQWHGVASEEDKIHLTKLITIQKRKGLYPFHLWENSYTFNNAWHIEYHGNMHETRTYPLSQHLTNS